MRSPLLLTLFFLALSAAPAGAATTFGSTLSAASDGAPQPCPGTAPTSCTAVRSSEGSPLDGVLLRWRVVAHPSATGTSVTLRVVRGATTVAESAPLTLVAGPQTVQAHVAIRKGDRLALAASEPLPAVFAAGGGATLLTGAGGTTTTERELLLNGDVEPDLDGDLAGDETEDLCPFDAQRQGRCVVDLSLAASATASAVVGDEAAHVYTARNAGPSGAANATVTAPVPAGFLRATTTDGTCAVVARQVRCRADVLPAGRSLDVTLFVTAAEPADVVSAAKVGSDGDETRAGDEEAAATTRFTPPSVAPEPTVLPMLACANPFMGGRDDDALFGTPFGDRLVGLGGRDLLRGRDGDDCLEGGAGNDVLDGGNGSDRLNGGLGRDRLLGGPGDDRLRGALKNDRLSAGPGNDVLEPGPGADAVDAGPGDDRIFARDGVRETIDCGPGRDTVSADRRDRLRGCEGITRR